MAEKGGWERKNIIRKKFNSIIFIRLFFLLCLGIILLMVGFIISSFDPSEIDKKELYLSIGLIPPILTFILVLRLENRKFNTKEVHTFLIILFFILVVYFPIAIISVYLPLMPLSLIWSGFFLLWASFMIGDTKKSNLFIVSILLLVILIPIISPIIMSYTNNYKCGCDSKYYEREPRPDGGNYLEFDHKRNILLIGTENGLGLYYPENDTYQLIGNDCISALAIDYQNDVYYIGTYTEGINKYYIRNDTLISNPSNFSKYKFIRHLTYDDFTESLIIGEYWSEGYFNSVFYDNTSNILFRYRMFNDALIITDYLNSSNSINIFLNDSEFRLHFVEDVDIDFDPKMNIVFLAFEYGSARYSETQGLVSYNLSSNETSYFDIPGFEYIEEIQDIIVNKKNHELFIATLFDGLFRYNMTTEKFKRFGNLENNNLECLSIDYQNDILYILTQRSLFKYYLLNGTIMQIN